MFSGEFDPDVYYGFNKYLSSIQGEEGWGGGCWVGVFFVLGFGVGCFFFFNILVNLEAAKLLLCKTPGKSIVFQQGFMWPLGFGLYRIASS